MVLFDFVLCDECVADHDSSDKSILVPIVCLASGIAIGVLASIVAMRILSKKKS